MKKSTFSLAFLLLILSLSHSLFINFSSAQNTSGNSLIRIFSENKVGYIDTTGKLIIPPKFANAYEFYDGLAAARVNSKYGFINTNGEFVFQPKYDYAESFRKGTALIYRDSIAGFLFEDGREIFFPNYRSFKFINSINDIKIAVVTYTKNEGIINNKGEILLDTIYNGIEDFENGLANVYKNIVPDNDRNGVNYEIAVIDTNIDFIVPFGKYSTIYARNGFINVTFKDSADTKYEGILNKRGELIMKENDEKMREYNIKQVVNDSIFTIVYNEILPDNSYSPARCYGILNTKTNLITKNEKWAEITALSDNSFLVSNKEGGKGFLINGLSEILIDTNLYDYLKTPDMDRSNIIAYRNSMYALYDKNGNELIPYQEYEIFTIEEFGNWRKKNLIYSLKVSNNYFNYLTKCILLGPDWTPRDTLRSYRYIFNRNGTLSAYDTSYYYCYNKNYDLIYKCPLYTKESFMNIDYMREQDFGFRSSSKNLSIKSLRIKSAKSGLSLFIDEDDRIFYKGHFRGLNLYFLNTSAKIADIGNRDFVNIKLQAKDKNGKWKYIEGQFYFFVDFTFERVKVKQNEYYKTEIPVFNGDFHTELRAELEMINPDNERKMLTIYSNEIKCKINESQFRRNVNLNFDFANPYLSIINTE